MPIGTPIGNLKAAVSAAENVMMSNTTAVPEEIMSKIRKLANFALQPSASAADVASAAAHLERLLEKYQLSLFDVVTQKYDEEVGETKVDVGHRLPKWTYDLARAVAKPHDCDYFSSFRYQTGQGKVCTMTFIGHKSDGAFDKLDNGAFWAVTMLGYFQTFDGGQKPPTDWKEIELEVVGMHGHSME